MPAKRFGDSFFVLLTEAVEIYSEPFGNGKNILNIKAPAKRFGDSFHILRPEVVEAYSEHGRKWGKYPKYQSRR